MRRFGGILSLLPSLPAAAAEPTAGFRRHSSIGDSAVVSASKGEVRKLPAADATPSA